MDDLIVVLRDRVAGLTDQEKTAWANLNFTLGRKAEAEELLRKLEQEPRKGEGT